MIEMKTLTIKGTTYEIIDDQARQNIARLENKGVKLFNVNLTADNEGNYTSDKTLNEIVTAHNTGNIVRCQYTPKDGVTVVTGIAQVITADGQYCVICPALTNDGSQAYLFIEVDGITLVSYSGGGTGESGKSAYEYALDAGYIGSEKEFATKLASVTLPNPQPLTINGQRYDGSSPVAITIEGGSGGSGKSAYEIALEHGFDGSEAEWLESLKGEQGKQGKQGIQGVPGEKGEQGIQGVKGAQGDAGSDGKSAYEYALDAGYIGSEEEFATKLASKTLPNPQPLTINGQRYDGSSPVVVSVEGGSGGSGGSGKSAYEYAKDFGYAGTEEAFGLKMAKNFPGTSVTDFGAVGDGVTDDTAAIQAALNSGDDIYFPAGRYKVTSKLTATKPCTISMRRQYPSCYGANGAEDYPKTSSDNWMGARIETYSPTTGIVIGDGVNLNGFYIRAMAGFGSSATASPYGGKGVVLQYDGSLGYRTYPASVRLAHIRVDIDMRKTEAAYATIPECLFDFRPSASYHYIIEDVILGQHMNRTCDYAFRADIANTASKWAHNVFVRNMCIDTHCDYGIYLTGNAAGWMFEGLTIQAYGYIPKATSTENYQDRPGHRALVKIAGVEDIGFYSCYLWDTAGTTAYPASYSDGGEIVVNGTAVSEEIKNGTTIISCVGCSSHFDNCETYIFKKLNSPENLNIKNLAMSVATHDETGANVLTLTDGSYERSVSIPAATMSENQINTAIAQWMDDAAIPKLTIGRNKFDASRNGTYSTNDPYNDYNFIGFMYSNGGYDNGTTMWTTHFIAAEYGDVIRMSKNGVLVQGFSFYCYDADKKLIKKYEVWSGASGQPEPIDYTKPHVAWPNTAYIRISFDRDKAISYPTDSGFPNLCITVNDADVRYEPYKESYEAKMGGILPSVTEADNGKILKVIDGAWTAVSP